MDQLSGVAVGHLEFSGSAIDQFIKLAEKGSVKSGEKVFQSSRAGCSLCHKVGSQGGNLGPDLTSAGGVIPKKRIVTEVLWPSQQIKEGYSLSNIVLKSGSIIQGYIQASRDKETVVIREVAGDSRSVVEKSDVDSISEIGTLMPETARSLTSRELGDLLAYLFHLGL